MCVVLIRRSVNADPFASCRVLFHSASYKYGGHYCESATVCTEQDLETGETERMRTSQPGLRASLLCGDKESGPGPLPGPEQGTKPGGRSCWTATAEEYQCHRSASESRWASAARRRIIPRACPQQSGPQCTPCSHRDVSEMLQTLDRAAAPRRRATCFRDDHCLCATRRALGGCCGCVAPGA